MFVMMSCCFTWYEHLSTIFKEPLQRDCLLWYFSCLLLTFSSGDMSACHSMSGGTKHWAKLQIIKISATASSEQTQRCFVWDNDIITPRKRLLQASFVSSPSRMLFQMKYWTKPLNWGLGGWRGVIVRIKGCVENEGGSSNQIVNIFLARVGTAIRFTTTTTSSTPGSQCIRH